LVNRIKRTPFGVTFRPNLATVPWNAFNCDLGWVWVQFASGHKSAGKCGGYCGRAIELQCSGSHSFLAPCHWSQWNHWKSGNRWPEFTATSAEFPETLKCVAFIIGKYLSHAKVPGAGEQFITN